MNGKKARQNRRKTRQAETARILANAVGKPGLYTVLVDDDHDGDVLRITEYDGTPKGQVLFEELPGQEE